MSFRAYESNKSSNITDLVIINGLIHIDIDVQLHYCAMFHITYESFSHLQHSPVFNVKSEKGFQSFYVFHLGSMVRSGPFILTFSQWENFSRGKNCFIENAIQK